ncbi:hypothetical protein [Alteromonas gracilis]|uniref:hypothetical protein n=1 Tax=Alteromonas gracilis TaxID=1479524 RepID=UPI002FDF23BA
MKKSIIALFASALVVSGVSAQTSEEKSGGILALGNGVTNSELVVSGAVAIGIAAAVINNNSSDAPGNGGDPIDPVEPTCEGDDPLVDGVCVGTTNTVTVTTSGTSTVTKTITVPVTFTYAPTVQ